MSTIDKSMSSLSSQNENHTREKQQPDEEGRNLCMVSRNIFRTYSGHLPLLNVTPVVRDMV